MKGRHLTPDSPLPMEAALFLHEGAVGAHVGILYRTANGGGHRLLHQAWHHDSRDEELAEYIESSEVPLLCVPPGMNEDEQADLRTHAALVARHLVKGGIPYAFRARDASISAEGSVNLGESLGLTCATFIIRLFDAARVPLLLEESWDAGGGLERKTQDSAAQAKLVVFLLNSRNPEFQSHAKRVQGEVGCTRIRAEEVAAASAMAVRPVGYALVEPAGRQLLADVQKLKAASNG